MDTLLIKDMCEVESVDCGVVETVKSCLSHDDTYYELSEFFRLFGDTTRLKIIHILSIKEVCVCDLAAILGTSQSSVSHKLKVLRQHKIVKPRKDGKMVYYSLTDDHVLDIFEKSLIHIME